MRISDWSSDVFSSDLLPVGRYGVHESEQIRYAHIVYCRCIQFGCVGDACQGGVTAVAAAVDGYALDRNSVAEGKSVSVRVDRGGRRIIKKKNTQRSNILLQQITKQ